MPGSPRTSATPPGSSRSTIAVASGAHASVQRPPPPGPAAARPISAPASASAAGSPWLAGGLVAIVACEDAAFSNDERAIHRGGIDDDRGWQVARVQRERPVRLVAQHRVGVTRVGLDVDPRRRRRDRAAERPAVVFQAAVREARRNRPTADRRERVGHDQQRVSRSLRDLKCRRLPAVRRTRLSGRGKCAIHCDILQRHRR
jgi:hypothetical protein